MTYFFTLFIGLLSIFSTGCGVESTNQSDSGNAAPQTSSVVFSGTITRGNGSAASAVTVLYASTGDSVISDAGGHYSLGPVEQLNPAEFIIEDDTFSLKASLPMIFSSSSESVTIDFTISEDRKNISTSYSQAPQSTPSPSAPSAGNSPFDQNGNTSSFGIPAGMKGNVNLGKRIYFGECAGCHPQILGKRASYSSMEKTLSKSPMNALRVGRSDIAHLVAYLNFIR